MRSGWRIHPRFIVRMLQDCMCRRLILLVFAVFSLLAGPAFAQGRYVRPERVGGAMPLERILPQIRSGYPGTFSDADGPFADPDGRLHYRIKWLTPDGRVIWLDADARSGHVLSVNHGWGGYGPYPRGYMRGPPGMPEGPPALGRWNHSWREIPGRFGGFRNGPHGGPRGGRGGRGR